MKNIPGLLVLIVTLILSACDSSKSIDVSSRVAISGTLQQDIASGYELSNPSTMDEVVQNSAFVTSVSVNDASGIKRYVTIAFNKLQDHDWLVQLYEEDEDIQKGVAPEEVGRLVLNFASSGELANFKAQVTVQYESRSSIIFDFSGFSEKTGFSAITKVITEVK